MSKIFRLHTNGSETVTDWQETTALQDVHIATIPDPAGAQVSHEITAIPTPFARIDIAKNAYRQVVASGQPDGNTIYHKVVSDCLDVLEIFFQAPLLGDAVEIIPWNSGVRLQGGEIGIDPASDLGALLSSASGTAQRLFGETLKMFLQQDATSYNFAGLKQLYLLNYTTGPQQLNIIGGTSPATLTFSSGNNLAFVGINLGDRKAFSGPPRALHRRTEDFILYVFALRDSIPGFSEKFREVSNYLQDVIFKLLPEGIKEKIRSFGPTTYSDAYTDIAIATTGAGDHPEVLGFPLRGIAGLEDKVTASDFRLIPGKGKAISGKLPLVLPTYTFPQPLKYVGAPWSPDTQVPFADAETLERRRLPGMNQVVYPYLTVSDLLEETLLRLPFAMDATRFFNGHMADSETGYLLPVKKEFFRYFSVEDIQGVVPGTGVKMFEMKKGVAGSVDVVLRLPVQKGHIIEFKRNYKVSQSAETPLVPSPAENKGVIADSAVTLAVYPFLKTGSDAHAHYRVLLVDADKELHTQHLRYSLSFYKDDPAVTEVLVEAVQAKADKSEDYFSTSIYALQGEFDLIQVSVNKPASGLLIPKLRAVQEGLSEMTFAVDFGTTNTYIAYNSKDNPAAQSFTMDGKDSQLGLLHLANAANYDRLSQVRRGLATMLVAHESDLIPETIGNATYRFPHRTVLAESKRLGRTEVGKALAGNNISFTYELRTTTNYQDVITNLKWAENDPGGRSRARISTFIEELVMLIRNKILLYGGSVEKSRVVWFYPSSMTQFERGRLENIWDAAVRKHLSPQTALVNMPESVAPFYDYKASGLTVGNSHSVNIDIGGGTTDIVLFKGETPVGSTSFRFAGNAIFGDGYGGNTDNNGFIQAFEAGQLRKILSDPNLPGQLGEVYKSLKDRKSSDDVISFLFSLQRRPEYAAYDVDFTRFLQEHPQLKLVPLLAFSGIMYHTARWMHAAGHEAPQNITFSGSGSRFLDILDVSRAPQFKNLATLANLIFTTVYGAEISGLRLRRVEAPKEVTARGGLYQAAAKSDGEVARDVWAEVGEAAQKLSYADLDTAAVQAGAVAEVVRFLEHFENWNNRLRFKDLFDVDMHAFAGQSPALRRDLRIFLEEGINRKKAESTTEPGEELHETLFFYPLIPLLHELAYGISQNPA